MTRSLSDIREKAERIVKHIKIVEQDLSDLTDQENREVDSYNPDPDIHEETPEAFELDDEVSAQEETVEVPLSREKELASFQKDLNMLCEQGDTDVVVVRNSEVYTGAVHAIDPYLSFTIESRNKEYKTFKSDDVIDGKVLIFCKGPLLTSFDSLSRGDLVLESRIDQLSMEKVLDVHEETLVLDRYHASILEIADLYEIDLYRLSAVYQKTSESDPQSSKATVSDGMELKALFEDSGESGEEHYDYSVFRPSPDPKLIRVSFPSDPDLFLDVEVGDVKSIGDLANILEECRNTGKAPELQGDGDPKDLFSDPLEGNELPVSAVSDWRTGRMVKHLKVGDLVAVKYRVHPWANAGEIEAIEGSGVITFSEKAYGIYTLESHHINYGYEIKKIEDYEASQFPVIPEQVNPVLDDKSIAKTLETVRDNIPEDSGLIKVAHGKVRVSESPYKSVPKSAVINIKDLVSKDSV